MKSAYYLLLVTFITFPLLLFGQHQEIKFGKISEEELLMEVYPRDSSASAVVLSDIGHTRFIYNQASGIKLKFTRHTRIKILTSDGYEHANVEIPLYRDGSEKEGITGVKGYTYNLIDGKQKKEKLRNSSEFIEKYSENYDIAKFTMPAVKVGSVLEYEYTITSDFLFNLQDWEFQKEIPVIWSEYNVAIPEYFNYKQFQRGYYPLTIHETGNKSDMFNFSSKTRHGGNGFRDAQVHTQYKNHSLNFTVHTERWAARDIPALVEEPYITTMDDYVMKVSFELSSIQFPGETMKIFTTSWEDIDKELLDAEQFGSIIDKKGAVKKLADELSAGVTDHLKKLAILYSYMRDEVRWNGEQSLFAGQTSKKTLDEQSGNSADINLTLIAMLRALGIQAEPVALSTRSHGMMISSYPMLKQYNYVIVQVNIEGQSLLLDATEQNCPYNLLPVRCLNGMGRIISEAQGEKWVNLDALNNADSKMMMVANVSFNQDRQLEANIKVSASDYQALKLRQKYHQKEEKRREDLEKENAGWNITHYAADKWKDVYESLEEDIEITTTDGILQAGNLIYFNPVLIDQIKENPFKLKDRMYPVDYAYTNKQMYMMNLNLPEGYEVEELPEDLIIALPESNARFIYQIKQIGHIIQVVNKLEINKSRFYAQEYPNLREFYNLIVAKQAEQIVLRKIQKSE
ncbi:uncharacterized protein YjhX (UPF0386 family) [Catalinimonas alkaloidigena]|uniref:transglutaminase domain-containing protein n=1 Tax=Catalinimonas alkaloidigena TaxID=1075417 RepID=UPI00240679D4|nr:DUF3857 domain-containing protein [Catalinimonas alkaloidigena]MDF9796623.1 uncharacterized protein YjhX (UPF0386 family) [Catalinimonas alkaloidigena]